MKTTLIFAVILLGFTGCESTVDKPEWPEYNEKLVVVGSVRFSHDDSVLVECKVRRTIPLWEEFTQEKTLLPTAHVQLDDGVQIHDVPLVSPENARFSKQVLRSGSNRYTLLVSEGTKRAHATLDLEPLPTAYSSIRIDTISFNEYPYTYTFRGAFHLSPDHNASFFVHYQMKNSLETEWLDRDTYLYYPNRRLSDYGWRKVPGDTLVFETYIYYWLANPWLARFTIEAYSSEYTEYILARSSYYGGDDFFGSPPKNPPFNVTGDGIGFFWYVLEGAPLELKFSR